MHLCLAETPLQHASYGKYTLLPPEINIIQYQSNKHPFYP